MNIWENLTKDFVRAAVTLGGFAVVCILTVTGKIDAKELVALVGMAVGFWFGTAKAD